MAFELIFIKETGLTKPAIGMQKYDITKVIDISSLHVLVQLGCGVQLLLFEDAGLFIQAHITQHSFMLLFQMLFEKCNVIEDLLVLAGFAIDLDEAFVFLEFLKLLFGDFSAMENITEIQVRQDFALEVTKFSELVRNHDLGGFVLS